MRRSGSSATATVRRAGDDRGRPRDGRRPRPRGSPARHAAVHRRRAGAHGIRPQDLVGAIANETHLGGREIGPIKIAERFSIVGVPERLGRRGHRRAAHRQVQGQAGDGPSLQRGPLTVRTLRRITGRSASGHGDRRGSPSPGRPPRSSGRAGRTARRRRRRAPRRSGAPGGRWSTRSRRAAPRRPRCTRRRRPGPSCGTDRCAASISASVQPRVRTYERSGSRHHSSVEMFACTGSSPAPTQAMMWLSPRCSRTRSQARHRSPIGVPGNPSERSPEYSARASPAGAASVARRRSSVARGIAAAICGVVAEDPGAGWRPRRARARRAARPHRCGSTPRRSQRSRRPA